MGVITLLSDYGLKDHYAAAVQARLLNLLPNTPVYNISHNVEKFNIGQGAYIINQVYSDFPTGSIHFIGINTLDQQSPRYLIANVNEHLFLVPDNGFLTLLEGQLNSVHTINDTRTTVFPVRDIFCPTAKEIIEGKKLEQFSDPITDYKEFKKREVKILDDSLVGNVIHIDDYGNLITNIDEDLFHAVRKDRRSVLKFRFEEIHEILQHYGQVEGGDIACFFNSSGFLEVVISKGNAAQLLGLKYDSSITIEFY